MLAVALVSLVGCENSNDPTPEFKGTLNVTEKSVEVAFYGGEGVINYTITNGAESDKPAVTSNEDWVNNITVADTITFNVDFNNVEEARIAILNVTYGEQSFDVSVRQAEGWVVDVEFVATALNGEYYGTTYSIDPNYFAILSKNGTTGWSDLYLDSYYRFDLYSATTTDTSAPVLPHGVFTFDYYDLGVDGTFGHPRSVLIETFENGISNVMLYDGDGNEPVDAMKAWSFASNIPWMYAADDDYTNTCAVSHSMYSPAGTSNDWMVTPQLYIPDGKCVLSFDAQSYRMGANDVLKVIVYASDESINELDAEIIKTMETQGNVVVDQRLSPGIAEEVLNGDWEQFQVKLEQFAGKHVYIAFVNQNTDKSAIFVGNIQVTRNVDFLIALVLDFLNFLLPCVRV